MAKKNGKMKITERNHGNDLRNVVQESIACITCH